MAVLGLIVSLIIGAVLLSVWWLTGGIGRLHPQMGAPDTAPRPPTVPRSRRQIELSFAPVVQAAAPAVVNVYARKRARSGNEEPFFHRFFGEPGQREQNALGSGVIVRDDGIVVTNNHVIAGGDELIVVMADRREYEAEVILADERTDLAVLRIDPKGARLPHIPFRDSDALAVGDIVLAIGNPFGVGQTTTMGIVSALARTQIGISDYQFFIQTDAAINPGNSGGALVTMDGRLAGINTAIFSRTGGSIGIGFAIPSNMVRFVVEGAVDGGRLRRAWLGATAQAVSTEMAAQLGLERPMGVLVQEVYPESPAAAAGLQKGDVILSVDGFEIFDPQGLRFRIATKGVGKSVTIVWQRDGARMSAATSLSGPPENPPRNITHVGGHNPLTGATIANLSPAFADELRIDLTEGVVVLSTDRGSPASRLRIRPGDIVVEVNGRKVESVDPLMDLLAMRVDRWRIVLRRAGQLYSLDVRS